MGEADTKRTAERRLHKLGLLPAELQPEVQEEFGRKPIPAVLATEVERARTG